MRKIWNAFYVFTLMFLIVFAGARAIGFDYEAYREIFNSVAVDGMGSTPVEVGWAFLCYLFGFLGFNLFLFFIATCSVTLFGIFFKKYSPYVFVALSIYYSSYFILKEMGQMRQGLAIAIATCAFTVSLEKKKWQFILLFVAAVSIHYSAVVLLPVYYLCNHIWKTSTLIIFIGIALCFTFIDLSVIITKVMSFLPITGAQEKVAGVLLSEAATKKLGINSSIILRLIIIGITLVYREPLSKRYPFFEAFIMLYFYGLLLYLVFNSLSEFAQRTSAYFRILEAIILPCFLTLISRRAERLVILVLLILNSFVSINRLFGPSTAYDAYNPYKTYLLK
jgi:hypothetical protein